MSSLTRSAACWFDIDSTRSSHQADLVMFPPAGGGTSSFRGYRPDTLGARLLVASLPGRGPRFDEPPIRSVTLLVEQVVEEVSPLIRKPFALFGHSLGAILAFEVARRLPQAPLALFVAGSVAPSHRRTPARDRASLTDDEFIEELRAIGGTPPAVLENREILEFMMPALRADFELVDTYEFADGPALACPIHVLAGEEDHSTPTEGMKAWGRHTTSHSTLSMIPGTHFFVQERPDLVQAQVKRWLRRELVRR